MQIDSELVARLRALPVQDIDELDGHTIVLHGVPVNHTYFAGATHTNLLFKGLRPAGRCWQVYCDETLHYDGDDIELTRAFATGDTRKGWRRLFLHAMSDGGIGGAIERALRALGAEGEAPRLTRPLPAGRARDAGGEEEDQDSLLRAFGVDLAEEAGRRQIETVGQEARVLDLLTSFSRAELRAVLISGAPGVGKTNLVWAAVKAATQRDLDLRFIAVDVAALFAGALFDGEREKLLTSLLSEVRGVDGAVLVLERADALLREAPHAGQHLVAAIDRGQRLLCTAPGSATAVFGQETTLKRRLQMVALSEPDFRQTEAILQAVLPRLAEYHGVHADESMARATLTASAPLPGCFPAKAVRVLDTAAARAALSDSGVIGLDDIYAASRCYESEAGADTAVEEDGGAIPGSA